MPRNLMPLSGALSALTALLSFGSPAAAQELYLGASFHAVDTPFSLETGEHGADVQAGYRTSPIKALDGIGRPSAYLHGQVSTAGGTSLVAAGLSWKIGDRVYLRPGIGLALHNDRIETYAPGGQRLDLGSRILFEPELIVGARLNEDLAAELSWVHTSHATLLSGQNPGMDFIGARIVLKLK